MPPRQEEVPYEQDRLGNERKKLDKLRAQEGMKGDTADDEGIVTIGTADTGTDILVYSKPTHAQQFMLDLIHAHNSQNTKASFEVLEAELDGAGNITSTTKRSVLIPVTSVTTRAVGYEGEPFTSALAVNSEFAGEIGVAVIADHHEENEPASEQTS